MRFRYDTFVNNDAVKERVLAHGDGISLGDREEAQAAFLMGDAEAAASPVRP